MTKSILVTDMWECFALLRLGSLQSFTQGSTRRVGGEGEREERKGGTERGWKMRRVGEDLWPCSLGLVTCYNWPPEWDRRVWSSEPRDQSNGNSTFLHCYSVTALGHRLIRKKKKKKEEKRSWKLTLNFLKSGSRIDFSALGKKQPFWSSVIPQTQQRCA